MIGVTSEMDNLELTLSCCAVRGEGGKRVGRKFPSRFVDRFQVSGKRRGTIVATYGRERWGSF